MSARDAVVHAELHLILEHASFRQSARCSKLLRYLVETSLIENAEPPKERAIGHEVFGRSASYDTYYDPVVRNAASDLRRRLRQYYHEVEGAPAIRMELPNGRYLIEFQPEHKSAPGVVEEALQAAAGNAASVATIAVEETLTAVPLERDRTRVYKAVAACVALLLLVAAGLLYSIHAMRPRNAFWDPVIADRARIVLSVGTNKAAAKLYPDKRLLTFANARAYAEIETLLRQRERNDLLVKPDVDTSMDDIRASTAILIGTPSNFWTEALSQNLRYRFLPDQATNTISIVDMMHTGTRWTVDYGLESGAEYAVVARMRSANTGGNVIFISGAGGHGTAAAAEFLTDSRYRDKLNRLMGTAANVEIVLKAEVIRGVIGSPEVVTSYSW